MSVKIEGVVCVAETDLAIKVLIEGEEEWIPQSQIEDESEVYSRGDEGTLVITDWIAAQRGLD